VLFGAQHGGIGQQFHPTAQGGDFAINGVFLLVQRGKLGVKKRHICGFPRCHQLQPVILEEQVLTLNGGKGGFERDNRLVQLRRGFLLANKQRLCRLEFLLDFLGQSFELRPAAGHRFVGASSSSRTNNRCSKMPCSSMCTLMRVTISVTGRCRVATVSSSSAILAVSLME
jgi:hypothetical protein